MRRTTPLGEYVQSVMATVYEFKADSGWPKVDFSGLFEHPPRPLFPYTTGGFALLPMGQR